MTPLKALPHLSLAEALELQDRARSGDAASAQEFFLYAVWRKIKGDPYIPARQKPKVFRALAQQIHIQVLPHG